jgi:Fic family protein
LIFLFINCFGVRHPVKKHDLLYATGKFLHLLFEKQMKQTLGASFSYELLQLMFAMPYLKIELLEKKTIAHRQTASVRLKKLADANILKPQKIGRTTYYINYRLMELLAAN